ncbi:MAG: hypothetical protein V4440_03395 [Pseudomonadota bacterium]
MKGYRTLLLNLGLAIAPVLQATEAADLGLTGRWALAYAIAVPLVNAIWRAFTTTPIFQSTPAAPK